MTTTTPRAELVEMITMLNEAIASVLAEGGEPTRQREVLAQYEAKLAAMKGDGGMIRIDHTEARNLLSRPEGGKAHSNQYGPCQVAYATDKQQAFALALFDRKDVTPLTRGVAPLDLVQLREALVARKINKKAISSLIDRLLACPDKTGAPATPAKRLATDKQLAFLLKLADERDFLSLVPADRDKVTYVQGGGRPTAAGASALIEVLLATVKADRPSTAARTIEAGVYVNPDGTTFRVYLGQQSGKMLAARVVNNDFEYAGAAERFVQPDARKMTAEEAGAWGKTTGRCVFCAKRLDVPTSVDRGIGPDCFKKYC